MNAFHSNSKQTNNSNKFVNKKKLQNEKKNQVCEFRKSKGHSKDTCFKIHVPKWLV